jgi:hypothetical protein
MNALKTFLVLSVVVLNACVAPRTATTETPKIQPRFDYAPKGTGTPGSAGLTIALINPSFAEDLNNINPFDGMRKNMANDFEELLTAKGFKIRGPFEQFGELLYDDKQNSDFIFEVEVDLNFRDIDRKRQTITETNWGKILNPYTNESSDTYYMYSGQGTIACNLVLTAKSTNYDEKLWKKNISLPAIPFEYEGKAKWISSNATLLDEIQKDNSVFNGISKLLESQYTAIFDLVDRQIDVDEMKTVAAAAKKVDHKG